MLNKISKTFVFVFVFSFCFTALSFAQENTDSTMNHKNMKIQSHKMDMKKDMHNMKTDSIKKMQSSIIRKGVIDVKAIDKNKDGKVFQDMMDYNVISDKPGKCPICGMTLKEVSIKQAEQTLVKAGFKYKK